MAWTGTAAEMVRAANTVWFPNSPPPPAPLRVEPQKAPDGALSASQLSAVAELAALITGGNGQGGAPTWGQGERLRGKRGHGNTIPDD